MQLTKSLRLFGLLKVVVDVAGLCGDVGMVLERFSMELVWLLEVVLLCNLRGKHVVVVVVVVVVEVETFVVVVVVDDGLQGLIVMVFLKILEVFWVVVSLEGVIVMVFWKSLKFFLVVVSLQGLVVKVFRKEG